MKGPSDRNARHILELQQAIEARLQQAAQSRTQSPVLEPEAVRQARTLARLLDGASVPPTTRLRLEFLLGWFHWHRFVALPVGRDQAELRLAIEMFMPCFMNGVDTARLPAALVPLLAEQSVPTGLRLLEQAMRSTDSAVLTAAVELWTILVSVIPENHSDRVAWMSNLANALHLRFEHSGVPGDLDKALLLIREAAATCPDDHPHRAQILSSLVNLLRTSYERHGRSTDLDEWVSAGRQAAAALPPSAQVRDGLLIVLSEALFTRFQRSAAEADLDEALRAARECAEHTPPDHPVSAHIGSFLAALLTARFEQMGSVADLDEAIAHLAGAVASTPPGDPDHARRLANLGITERSRSERTGSPADIATAIEHLRQAVAATSPDHPDRGQYLFDLAQALGLRFGRQKAMTDLDAAVDAYRQAAKATPAGHPERSARLTELARSLGDRYDQTRSVEDCDEAVASGRQALAAAGDDTTRRADRLSDLGIYLASRFERLGTRADLNEAVRLFDAAREITDAGAAEYARYSTNLASALATRFTFTGDSADLDEAIRVSREAAEADPTDHLRGLYTYNLASALRHRFDHTGALSDIDEAVLVGREAADSLLPSQHPSRADRLSGLANTLISRGRRIGSPADLEEAVDTMRRALTETPQAHPDRARYLDGLAQALLSLFSHTGLAAQVDEAIRVGREAASAAETDFHTLTMFKSNLAASLVVRFALTGASPDLDEAIRASQEAVAATAAERPDRAHQLSNLGAALVRRFEVTGTPSDRDAAIEVLTDAADIVGAPPSVRIDAARRAGALAAESQPHLAASLLEKAIRLLPQVAPRRQTRQDQQHALSGLSGLASDAAALVLSDPVLPASERPALALQLLEAGRAVMLGQAMEVRGDLTDLAMEHPHLADRFVQLRDLLDSSHTTGGSTEGSSCVSLDRHRLATEMESLLDEIRRKENYRSFARPPSLTDLLQQAYLGPIVFFNVSPHRSDALLLTADGVLNQPLPDLSHDAAVSHVNAFHQALRKARPGAPPAEREAARRTLMDVLEWLWDTAVGPVLEALSHATQPSTWPRVWWASVGPLGLLPIHAAGHHSDPPGTPGRRTALDRVVSSFTPTVAALRYARQGAAALDDRPALIVAMPTTPGVEGRLDFAADEAQLVADLLPGSITLSEPHHVPTIANVLQNLTGHSVVHFACHGRSDPEDPSRSRLLLHDEPLTVATVSGLRLRNPRLAYLSACETALTTNTHLMDEAIHLASAFQLAGYPHVVGTLWAVNDVVATHIAVSFYAALTGSGSGREAPGEAHPAHALHQATRAARDTFPADPALWAAHIHTGA